MDSSALRDQQYRPVSVDECSTNSSMSVRALRDLAMGINNAFARACAPQINDAWPGLQFWDARNDTDEHVLLRFPAWKVGVRGNYTHANWSVAGYIGASSENCAIKLYSAERYYRGPSTMTATSLELLGNYSSSTLTMTAQYTASEVLDAADGLAINPDSTGETYLLLTVTFAGASANNYVNILTGSATLTRITADIL